MPCIIHDLHHEDCVDCIRQFHKDFPTARPIREGQGGIR